MNASSGGVEWHDMTGYRCPKHGPVGRYDHINVEFDGLGETGNGKYCGVCFAEWVAQHIPKLVPTNGG